MQTADVPHSRLSANAILLLGAQRSGTTWLGKIFDSHPDVLYRHEPDHARTPPPGVRGDALRAVVADWIRLRDPRTAGKRPFFRKSWQSAPEYWLWQLLTGILTAGSALPGLGSVIARLPIPDLVPSHRASSVRVALKSIDWHDGAGAFARSLPNSRTVLLLRHPCGQIASVMRGSALGRFTLREPGTSMPFGEVHAAALAAKHGVEPAEFQALPDAAKYAWAWVAFNEAAIDGLDGLPNARIVVYEDLCAHPADLARDLLAFAGLNWNAQTEQFIVSSTLCRGAAGYYSVFRDSIAAANLWRTRMPPEDQDAVRAVVRRFPRLAQRWSDIGAGCQ